MILTLRVQNSQYHDVTVRSSVASEQPVPAQQSVEFTLEYTEDMGPLVLELLGGPQPEPG